MMAKPLFSRPLILASTSPYRRALLERLGVPFEAVSPKVDEKALPGEQPALRARRLALAKANAVAQARPEAIVIGSDQVASVRDQILDKPGDAQRCRIQLQSLSGQHAFFHTACAVVGISAQFSRDHIDTTRVRVRELTADEIERYIEREKPFDCAGGFKSEGLGISLFEQIENRDPTALIGLPLIWVAEALRAAGYRVP